MSEQKSKPVIVLPPPVVSLSVLSNKYDLVLDIRWGSFEKTVKISRESFNFSENLVREINEALVEGSETNPYLTK